MKILNKKGFTLVELLAVIVILAIIILFAMPAVISTMATARAGTFKNEIHALVSEYQTAFSRESMIDSGKVSNKEVDGKYYRYMCMTLEDLYKNGYTDKAQFEKDKKYKGYYEVFVPANGVTNAIYGIHYTNGQFTVDGLAYSYVSSDAYKPSYSPVTDDWGTCPNDENIKFPAESESGE